MILQALVDYYESLAAQGKLAKPGWGKANISYALDISEIGELLSIRTLLNQITQGKKTIYKPQSLLVPEATKRSSGIAAQFLWDNARYMLGIDALGKEERAKQCFMATAEKAQRVLEKTHGKTANAIKAFFANWKPETAKENVIIKQYIEELLGAGNIVFRIDGEYAHNDLEIVSAWDAYYTS